MGGAGYSIWPAERGPSEAAEVHHRLPLCCCVDGCADSATGVQAAFLSRRSPIQMSTAADTSRKAGVGAPSDDALPPVSQAQSGGDKSPPRPGHNVCALRVPHDFADSCLRASLNDCRVVGTPMAVTTTPGTATRSCSTRANETERRPRPARQQQRQQTGHRPWAHNKRTPCHRHLHQAEALLLNRRRARSVVLAPCSRRR